MKINKRVLALALLVSLSLLATFSGCAPKGSEKETGPIVVEMWVMPNSLEPLTDLEKVLALFLAENPGIKVKVAVLDWGAAWTKITTAATSKDVPDIVQLGSTWVGSISSFGALLNLNDRIEELGGKDAFVPAAWTSSGLIDSGQVTAIPWIVDARALYYRTDVFNELGLSAKDLSTWDSFERALKKIKDARLVIDGLPIVPLGMPGKNDWNVVHNLSPWIWAAGGDYLSSDAKRSLLGERKAYDGVFFYINLAKKGYVPLEFLELNTAQVSSNFNNGSCAIYFDGPYEVKTLTTPPEQGGALGSIASKNFGIAPYPKGPSGRYTFIGGSNLAIFKASKHKEEAWKVIKYLLTKEAQISYIRASGFLPAKREAFDDPFISSDPHRKVFREAIKYGKTYPCIPAWGVLEPVLTRRFGILWDYVTGTKGDLDKGAIEQQLDLAKSEVDTILNQSR